jgi:hypothetical protein
MDDHLRVALDHIGAAVQCIALAMQNKRGVKNSVAVKTFSA